MPDAGVPRAPLLDPLVTKSHTGTQQWQSFEIRMRRRRAERCRLRAEVAIEAGCLDDAQEALDEARRLQPELPELAVIEQRLADSRVQVAAPVDVRPRTGARRLAAVASLALVAGTAAWFGTGAPASAPGPGLTASAASTQAPAAATYNKPADVPAAPDVGVGLVRAATSAPVGVRDPPNDAGPLDPDTERATADTHRDSGREPLQQLVTAAPVIVVPPPEPARPPADVAAPEAPSLTAESAVPLPSPMTSVPAPGPPSTVAASGAPAADPGAEAKVRAALARYEAAYSALNAAAARAIWPTVNAGALGRAFEGLESQRISLGDCQISLASTGQTANATCAGSATWTPKVGDGTRTEARRWSFDLELTGERWHIVRATTR